MLINIAKVNALEIYRAVCKTQLRNIKAVFVKIDKSVIQGVSGGICHSLENVLLVNYIDVTKNTSIRS
jgi:hypothetical protein